MKTDFSRQIFEKSSNIKFHQNPSSESRVVPCEQKDRHRRTDGHEANNRFLQFANAPEELTCHRTQTSSKGLLCYRVYSCSVRRVTRFLLLPLACKKCHSMSSAWAAVPVLIMRREKYRPLRKFEPHRPDE